MKYYKKQNTLDKWEVLFPPKATPIMNLVDFLPLCFLLKILAAAFNFLCKYYKLSGSRVAMHLICKVKTEMFEDMRYFTDFINHSSGFKVYNPIVIRRLLKIKYWDAWLTQLEQSVTLNLRVMSLSSMLGVKIV